MWIFSAIANAVGRNFIGRPNYLFDLLFNRAQADGGVTEAQQCTINELTDLQNDNLLSSASLVLTPSSYKEGTLYSVIPENGAGDMSVTRATTATRVNSAGLVELVPYNLVQQSEVFSNAAWTKSASSVTANITTAPDGTLTADKLVEDATNASHFVFQSVSNLSTSSDYTLSVFLKASERFRFRARVTGYSGANDVSINLNTQTTIGGGTLTSVGNGWFRFTYTVNVGTGGSGPLVAIYLQDDLGNTTYLGNGTSGAFIWGAQLVEGTNALPYQKTETRLNIPRLDYSLGGCPNILLEPQRTNLALQSSSFDSGSWAKAAVSVTANSTTSPSGIVDADTFTADGSSGEHRITQIISFTSGLTYTFSVYIKKNTNDFAQLTFGGGAFGNAPFANFNVNNGTLGSTGGSATSTITSVGNGWYRCTLTATATGTFSDLVYLVMTTSSTSLRRENNSLSTSVFLWGAQLEAGSYATSYIPTTTASVTRNADQCVKTGISSLIGQTEGTMFIQLNMALISEARRIITLYNDINNYISLRITSGNSVQLLVVNASATQVSIVVPLSAGVVKLAAAYKVNDFVFYVNGIEVGADTNGTVPTTSSIYLGYDPTGASQIASGINAATLWKERLTNAQLAQLTTI